MMRNRKFSLLFFIPFCLVFNSCFTQNFSFRALVQEVKVNGWHKIILNQQVLSNSKNDLSDIRLSNFKNEEIPFALVSQNSTYTPNDSLIFNNVKKEFFELENDTSRRITILKFKFEKPLNLDKIVFVIEAPKYYFRDASLFINRTEEVKHKPLIIKECVTTFKINSKKKLIYDLQHILAQDIFIEIENNDNMPLKINDIQFKQLATLLVADLKRGEKYYLKFGDLKLLKPNYDISYFIENTAKMPYLSVNDSESLTKQREVTEPMPTSLWQKPWFLWVSIAFGAIVLFFFSKSLVSDMQKK